MDTHHISPPGLHHVDYSWEDVSDIKLDLTKPNLELKVTMKHNITLSVLLRDSLKWLKRTVTFRTGPVSYGTELDNGRLAKCHIDHIHVSY